MLLTSPTLLPSHLITHFNTWVMWSIHIFSVLATECLHWSGWEGQVGALLKGTLMVLRRRKNASHSFLLLDFSKLDEYFTLLGTGKYTKNREKLFLYVKTVFVCNWDSGQMLWLWPQLSPHSSRFFFRLSCPKRRSCFIGSVSFLTEFVSCSEKKTPVIFVISIYTTKLLLQSWLFSLSIRFGLKMCQKCVHHVQDFSRCLFLLDQLSKTQRC